MRHFFLVSSCLLLFLQQAKSRTDDRTTCKPVTASFCQGLGYTSTPYPSGAQGFSLYQVGKMVETACSPHIATVMCRVVVPECGSENESQKKPCRALCDKVKRDCEPTLRAKWLFWPSRLRCDSLPVSNCVQVSWSSFHFKFIRGTNGVFKISIFFTFFNFEVHEMWDITLCQGS